VVQQKAHSPSLEKGKEADARKEKRRKNDVDQTKAKKSRASRGERERKMSSAESDSPRQKKEHELCGPKEQNSCRKRDCVKGKLGPSETNPGQGKGRMRHSSELKGERKGRPTPDERRITKRKGDHHDLKKGAGKRVQQARTR